MWEVLSFLIALFIGYICFVALSLLMIQLMFPMQTKEDMEKQKIDEVNRKLTLKRQAKRTKVYVVARRAERAKGFMVAK